MGKPYTLTDPCKSCPFLTDQDYRLGEERARGIVEETEDLSNFVCHKTVNYTEEGGSEPSTRNRPCAGMLIIREKEGRRNAITQIAERLGIFDPSILNLDAPVHDSLDEWIESQKDGRP
jgi:hypothetical protein